MKITNVKARQCLTNLFTLIDHYQISRKYLQLISVRQDRAEFFYQPEFLERLKVLAARGYFAKHWWETSYRENVCHFSMEISPHKKKKTVTFDIDLNNPWYDMVSALCHLAEICQGTTDPFEVMDGLKKRGFTVRDEREAPNETEGKQSTSNNRG